MLVAPRESKLRDFGYFAGTSSEQPTAHHEVDSSCRQLFMYVAGRESAATIELISLFNRE